VRPVPTEALGVRLDAAAHPSTQICPYSNYYLVAGPRFAESPAAETRLHTRNTVSLCLGSAVLHPVRVGLVRAARFRRRGQIARRSAPGLFVAAANAVRAGAPRLLPITPISLLGSR
jgi:hypothetical protein